MYIDVVDIIAYVTYSMCSTVDDIDDAWSHLASLKVFKPTTARSALDLIDIRTASLQSGRIMKPFNATNVFEQYLNQASIEGGTRFM